MQIQGILWNIIHPVIAWTRGHPALVWWFSVFSIITFFGSLLLIPMMVIRMPEDYFLYDARHLREFRKQHPVVRFFSVILKNILGFVFIVAGAVMLFLPGQGVITMLIGLTLINFPRKRAMERRIIQQESVHKAVNWIRARAGKPPVEVPERD